MTANEQWQMPEMLEIICKDTAVNIYTAIRNTQTGIMITPIIYDALKAYTTQLRAAGLLSTEQERLQIRSELNAIKSQLEATTSRTALKVLRIKNLLDKERGRE